MRVAIVGGGLAGLAAARDLSGDFEVHLFEERGNPGGAAASVERNGYHVERLYHHIFKSDEVLIDLIEELGLGSDLEWRVGRTSFLVDGEVYPLNTPLEILRYPHLSLLDKVRLALFVRKSQKADYEAYDDVPAIDLIKKEVGNSVYESFFRPLLRAKFGTNASRVSGAWLMGRAHIRSHRSVKGEVLGYLRGGFERLVQGMAKSAEERGCRFEFGSSVSRVKRTGDGVVLEVDGEEREFDAVVLTCAPGRMEDMLNGFDSGISYQGVCCLIAAMDEKVLNDTYWLNLAGEHPFGAVIQHTNLVPEEDYGEHLLYLVSYHQSPDEDNLVDPVEEVADRFFDGLDESFPGASDSVTWYTVSRGPDAGPVYETGYLDKVIPHRLRDGVYSAGMFSRENYPERSMDGSVRAGLAAAAALRRDVDD